MSRVQSDAEYAAMTLPRDGVCIVDTTTALMDRKYFEQLYEYSTTLPTGTYIGKRWRRQLGQVRYGRWYPAVPAKWMMGEFAIMPEFTLPELSLQGPASEKTVRILWREIVIEES